jgi:manganese/iron transport system permease protein
MMLTDGLALTDLWSTPFMQRALIEILLLAVLGGVLGAWIVLRRVAFYSHAVGAAVFPGLVVAGPWGIPAQLAALGAAILFAGGQQALTRTRRINQDAATGLLLVAALAIGVILASDVYESGGQVDSLLFGTLVGITSSDVLITAGVVVAVLVINLLASRNWLASGFDSRSAKAMGLAVSAGDLLLFLAAAIAVVVSVKAVGALLVTAILVIPAATMRLVTNRLLTLQLGSVLLAAFEGVVALWLALQFNIGPGPMLAMVGGVGFVLVSVGVLMQGRISARNATPLTGINQ